MPFKSEAQRRKFAHMVKEGKIPAKTYQDWDDKTGAKPLPERVKKPEGPAGKGRTRTGRYGFGG